MSEAFNKMYARSKWRGYDKEKGSKMTESHYIFPLVRFTGEWKTPKLGNVYDREKHASKTHKAQIKAYHNSTNDVFTAYHIDKKHHSVVYKMMKKIGFNVWWGYLHNQSPGQQFMLHMDSDGSKRYPHWSPKERATKLQRIIIFLDDWKPGQVVSCGNDFMYHWKKGDTLWFNWWDTPHGTANFGHHERPAFIITGETTDKFEKIKKKKFSRIKV